MDRGCVVRRGGERVDDGALRAVVELERDELGGVLR
jgi:hypothetical protein